jgi:hypothetical protein
MGKGKGGKGGGGKGKGRGRGGKGRSGKGTEDQWWRTLDDDVVDPISLEIIAELPYHPFILQESEDGHKHLFDGAVLAHYLVSTGVFENPVNRVPLDLDDCSALDRYLSAYSLQTANVVEAYQLQKSVKVKQNRRDANGNLIPEEELATRAVALQREAATVLSGMFQFRQPGGAADGGNNRNVHNRQQNQRGGGRGGGNGSSGAQDSMANRRGGKSGKGGKGKDRQRQPTLVDGAFAGDGGMTMIDDDLMSHAYEYEREAQPPPSAGAGGWEDGEEGWDANMPAVPHEQQQQGGADDFIWGDEFPEGTPEPSANTAVAAAEDFPSLQPSASAKSKPQSSSARWGGAAQSLQVACFLFVDTQKRNTLFCIPTTNSPCYCCLLPLFCFAAPFYVFSFAERGLSRASNLAEEEERSRHTRRPNELFQGSWTALNGHPPALRTAPNFRA